jgi:hypothetical protein
MDMLSAFLNNKHLSSAKEPKAPTEELSEPISEGAWEETSEDVMNLCDLSHLNHQQRQEFHKNAVYSETKPVRDSSHKDRGSQKPISSRRP